MINTEFEFHPVGQGCFYTGKISYKRRHREFSMVYDCGTLSCRTNLHREISTFRNELGQEPINMLVLSHLDDDHVNGVKELIEGKTCRHIYLPYLTPIQRLIVAIRQNPREIPYPDDYLAFLTSPHNYLINIEGSEIEKINYINGNSKGDFNPERSNELPENPNDIDFVFQDKLEILTAAELSSEMSQILTTHSHHVIFKKGNGSISSKFWEFYLYHETAGKENIDQLLETINDIYDLNITIELSQNDLEIIFKDKNKLKELRKKFRTLFKSLNKTGLLIQHQPIGYETATLTREPFLNSFNHYFLNNRYRRFNREIFTNDISTKKSSWGTSLLTGDICFNQIACSAYIKRHLKRVLILQIPHHGSNFGWFWSQLIKFNLKGTTSAVINYGYGNLYGHPHPDVLTDLVRTNLDVRFCNQFERFRYSIKLGF